MHLLPRYGSVALPHRDLLFFGLEVKPMRSRIPFDGVVDVIGLEEFAQAVDLCPLCAALFFGGERGFVDAGDGVEPSANHPVFET